MVFSVFYEFGVDIVVIGVQLNGLNINDGFGVMVLKVLCDVVFVYCVDFGVVLDGDVDWIQMVDVEGNFYDGDQLFYVIV